MPQRLAQILFRSLGGRVAPQHRGQRFTRVMLAASNEQETQKLLVLAVQTFQRLGLISSAELTEQMKKQIGHVRGIPNVMLFKARYSYALRTGSWYALIVLDSNEFIKPVVQLLLR